jgi:glycosyltransferase involved in cell wall biosynthesis
MTASLSVVVTTYNSPVYLGKVLEGYLDQTVFPCELIVADDGSTAETAEVVKAFQQRTPFTILHVWQEDLGFRAARIRNEAVRSSAGDYLVFSDGDCVPHRQFIQDHLRHREAGFFVQGKRMLVSQKSSPGFRSPRFGQLATMCLRRELSGCHHLLRLPGLAVRKNGLRGIKTCNLALSRADFLAVNGFNEEFTGWGREDAELVARLYKYGLRRKDPPFSALVYHLWHPENPRDDLDRNDLRLAEALSAPGYACRHGYHQGESR